MNPPASATARLAPGPPDGGSSRGKGRENLFAATVLLPVVAVALLAVGKVALRHADAVLLALHRVAPPSAPGNVLHARPSAPDIAEVARYASVFADRPPQDSLGAEYQTALRAIELDQAAAAGRGTSANPGLPAPAHGRDASGDPDGRDATRAAQPEPLDRAANPAVAALPDGERSPAVKRLGRSDRGPTSRLGQARFAQVDARHSEPLAGSMTSQPRVDARGTPDRVAGSSEPLPKPPAARQEQAADPDPASPEAQARQGRLGQAEAGYRDALASDPRDLDALLGLAGVLSREGRDDEARPLLATADDIGGGRRARQARADALREQAQGAVDPATRTALYREALALNPADPWIRLGLARALAARNEQGEARALMAAATRGSAGADDLRAAIIFASETGDAEAAGRLIARLPASARTSAMQALLAAAELKRDMAAATALPPPAARRRLLALAAEPDPDGSRGAAIARAMATGGDVAGAREALAAAQGGTRGAPVAARLADAAAYLDIGDVASARRLFDGIDGASDLTLDQRPAYAQLGAALALRMPGSPGQAGLPTGGTASASLNTPEVLARGQKIGAAGRFGDRSLADARSHGADGGAAPTPDAAEPHAIAPGGPLAAPAMQADYRYRRVLDTTPTALQPPEAAPEAAASGAAPPGLGIGMPGVGSEMPPDQGGITGQAALAIRSRSGDSGLGRLTELTAPLEAEFSPGGFGRLKLAVVPTSLVAGRIGSDTADARRFGTGALGLAPAVAGRSEHAEGVGLDLAYALANLNADLGATPLGFPTQHVVGGLSYAPVLADGVRLRALVERRAVTDSVLSYAGARDPRTGATWGGEVRSRGRADVEFDVWRARAYVGGGGGVVTGSGTPSNGEREAGAGLSYPVYATDSRSASVGLDLAYSGYARNLRYFTLGQGGYFSPQSYVAALVPVRYLERVTATLSYEVGAALGIQSYRENAAPYYPADAALQARLAASPGGLPATYAQRSRTGFAGNGHGSVDYRPMPNLHLGAVISAQRAGDFTEASGIGYARYTFGEGDP